MLSYIARFAATSLGQVETRVNELMPPLVKAVYPTYSDIIAAFSTAVSDKERQAIIASTQRPKGLNALGQGFGADSRYAHGIAGTLRRQVLERDQGRCQRCGSKVTLQSFHADHIVPHSKGGLTVLENLQALCASCNLAKGNRD